ncbi:4Fe-4S binding protein [Thermanaeromonas toyohensis]
MNGGLRETGISCSPEKCILCGYCTEVCPQFAIRMI